MPTIKSGVLVNHLTNTLMVKWSHQKFHCCIWGIIKLHMSNKIWSNVASSEKLGGRKGGFIILDDLYFA